MMGKNKAINLLIIQVLFFRLFAEVFSLLGNRNCGQLAPEMGLQCLLI